MGKPATDDLFVHTDGCCFLCLGRIITNDYGSEYKQLPIHSIQQLSRYLKMDMGKVFHDKRLIPQKLLAKVERSRLKVELCQGCESMSNAFSALYQQREKIDMEMLACLKLIQGKLGQPSAPNSGMSKRSVPGLNGKSELMMGRTEVAEALRKEAAQKCFQKLGKAIPRVKVHKLNAGKLVQSATLNQTVSFNEACQSASIPKIEAVEIKTDRADSVPGLAQDLDDDDWVEDPLLNKYSDHSESDCSYEEPNETMEDCKAFVPPSSSSSTRPPPIIITPNKSKRKPEKPQSIFDPATGKHKCTLCSQEFAQKIAVQHHYDSIHLKVKYKCSLCGNLFNQESSYIRHHQSVHLGIRLKCQKCNKVFVQKSSLYTHLRKTPCGEGWTLKPHQRQKQSTICPHCGEKFSRLDHMRRHVKRFHLKRS